MKRLDIIRTMSLVTQLGFSIAIPTIGGAWLGRYLNRKFGLSGIITVLFIIMGLISGFMNVYHILKRDMDKDRRS